MWRAALRWLAPALLAGALFVPHVRAQMPEGGPGGGPPGQPPPAGSGAVAQRGPGDDVIAYALALFGSLVVLLVVCAPSRKGFGEKERP